MNIQHVSGKNASQIMIYALSTCPWCRKAKELFKELGSAYDYVDVDLEKGKDREEAIAAAKKWNPSLSFPIIVVNGSKAILGFKEDEIRNTVKQAAG